MAGKNEVTEETDYQAPAKGGEMNKSLIIILMTTAILFVVFAIVNYLVVENLLTQKMSKLSVGQEEVDEDADGGEDDEVQKGIIVELGDFILNLCDETQKKYLKVNVTIEVSQKDTDVQPAVATKEEGKEEGAASVNPVDAIQTEMNQYKPAIRDAVITNLSSKTSAELSTAAGKELAKEQITNDINSILGGEREVLRVSFGQFIIQ